MEKNYSFLYIDKYLLKTAMLLFKNTKLLGKNQIFFKKNYFFFKKLENNTIFVLKGNKFRSIKISYFNLGYRFGSFVFTRKPFKYLIKTKISGKTIKR
jgi:ribosomal protein S19